MENWRGHGRYDISGDAGLVDSHMCESLLDQGFSVLALDNSLTGCTDNIDHLRSHANFEFRRQDVTEPLDVEGPVHCVIHMASLASSKDYLEHPIDTLEPGSTATRNMLELACRKGASFLLTSTSECYGDPL